MTYVRPFDDNSRPRGDGYGGAGNRVPSRISATLCKWLGAVENILRRKSGKKGSPGGDGGPDGQNQRDDQSQHRSASAANNHFRTTVEKAVTDNAKECAKTQSALDAWGLRMSADVKKVSGE